MIIEGKHSDVGQGIFISDIQENSNAENVSTSTYSNDKSTSEISHLSHLKAGVKIGEMILAVNKDLLIDTNYDTVSRNLYELVF